MSTFYIAFTTILFYFMHSLLIHPPVEQRLSPAIIPGPYYRLFYNSISLLLILPIIWSYTQYPKASLFTSTMWNRIPGAFMILIGIWVMRLSYGQYNMKVFTGLEQIKPSSSYTPQLNKGGINGRVRHPLYLASLLLFWGAVLVFPNSGTLVIATVTSLYLLIGIRLEERKLIAEYGEAYKQYRKEVPMLIPKLKMRATTRRR